MINDNPFEVFKTWYQEASFIEKHNAMSLATSNIKGIPSVRTVLLKEYNNYGFSFYTNLKSKKSCDMLSNPNAEILFFWKELERQIRISGIVHKVDNEEANRYFASRARESQIATWASKQSNEIPYPQALADRYKEIEEIFLATDKIPRPEFWSGFILMPHKFEFWQERPHRLHIRHLYTLEHTKWQFASLYP